MIYLNNLSFFKKNFSFLLPEACEVVTAIVVTKELASIMITSQVSLALRSAPHLQTKPFIDNLMTVSLL